MNRNTGAFFSFSHPSQLKATWKTAWPRQGFSCAPLPPPEPISNSPSIQRPFEKSIRTLAKRKRYTNSKPLHFIIIHDYEPSPQLSMKFSTLIACSVGAVALLPAQTGLSRLSALRLRHVKLCNGWLHPEDGYCCHGSTPFRPFVAIYRIQAVLMALDCLDISQYPTRCR